MRCVTLNPTPFKTLRIAPAESCAKHQPLAGAHGDVARELRRRVAEEAIHHMGRVSCSSRPYKPAISATICACIRQIATRSGMTVNMPRAPGGNANAPDKAAARRAALRARLRAASAGSLPARSRLAGTCETTLLDRVDDRCSDRLHGDG